MPTRQGVECAIAELAYRPSRLGRSVVRCRHDGIGIIVPDLSGPYFSSVILGYEEASAATMARMMIVSLKSPIAAVIPALTTVRQMLDLGRRAAALLEERITTNRTEPRHGVLPTELVVRSSCGCNAAANRKEE